MVTRTVLVVSLEVVSCGKLLAEEIKKYQGKIGIILELIFDDDKINVMKIELKVEKL